MGLKYKPTLKAIHIAKLLEKELRNKETSIRLETNLV